MQVYWNSRSKRLHSLYLKADYEEKAKMLKMIASNFLLNSEKLEPVYRKPFALLARNDECTKWLPDLDRIRNFFYGTIEAQSFFMSIQNFHV
ncbi:MAG: hypothetical protein A2Y62_19850 [Candidatus Fischerbacteria bacterium RBG_13_37_8]|uniref:Uncharacterized protein n=1 Tax=Candidatus Fischerbacteria bacterium RBG_13_37_8 TaxID=1817863 RepID=A0A1F5VL85_9BACT|nr:MAG: hypothetical protein A2Y62_19850 [Candidatus Fischerbacteria bacterium RBG_13_37_8]